MADGAQVVAMRRNEDGVTMVESFEEIMAEWEAANGAHQEPLEIVAQATQAVQGQPQPPAHTAAFEMARRFLDIGYSLLPIQRDASEAAGHHRLEATSIPAPHRA